MKSLVIFYSFEGNCKMVAEEIQSLTGADLLQLKPVHDMKSTGFSKFLWGGRQIVMGEEPELEPFDVKFGDYDMIFIGTPVWAWTYSPALKSFFSQKQICSKKVALFCCHGGGKGKTLEKMKAHLEGNEIIGEIDFREPLKRKATDVPQRLKNWLEEIKTR